MHEVQACMEAHGKDHATLRLRRRDRKDQQQAWVVPHMVVCD